MLHCWPGAQQRPHPHSVCPGPQIDWHWPPTHCCPHPHGGLHGLGWQVPPEQNSPPGHEPLLHVPPQPSDAPHALPVQFGWQWHWPPWQNSLPGQLPWLQMPPQPLDAPQALPTQFGVQHWCVVGSQL
jgi:hypothetical protein